MDEVGVSSAFGQALDAGRILTINSGSSSLKFGVYSTAEERREPVLSGEVTRIGQGSAGVLTIQDGSSEAHREKRTFAAQSHALEAIAGHIGLPAIAAVGHRIVHGGPKLRQHQLITDQVLKTLETSVHFAPLHIPPALELIRSAQARFPGVLQYACFDTAFHTTMPPEAFTYAIPLVYREAGVQRYGFHGLSYESVVKAMGANVPRRMIVAHLGSGASLCAMLHGQSIDTSMGVSPTGGIPMGTRTGDLDPGVVLMMVRGLPGQIESLDAEALEQLVNHDAGLLALSGTTADMREVTSAADAGNPAASLALTIFCREVAKTVGAYAAVLDGLDALIFTGGIGEHSARVRRDVCARLGFLGIALESDPPASARRISVAGSPVQVLVVQADEDRQIADHVSVMMREAG